jgi:phospholipase C
VFVPRFSGLLAQAAGLGTLLLALTLAGCGSNSSPGSGQHPSYSLSASAFNPATVTAGNAANATLTLTPANGYTGTVTLSCTSVTGGTPAPTCSFNGSQVTISSAAPVTSTLTVSTSANAPGGPYNIVVTGADAQSTSPSNGPQTLALTTAAVLQHIVIIFQENRTPDNLFQDSVLVSRGADIASSGVNSQHQTIQLAPMDLGTTGPSPQNYDLSHAHSAFVSMYDGGAMDGADLIPCTPAASCPSNPQFKYVTQSDVQPYFAMAEQYVFGDRMFQTNEGPSFPAHQFIISGTSAPLTGSNLFAAENPSNSPAGCIAPSTETVTMIGPLGSETAHAPQYPCFEHETLTDELDAANVSWRYYAPSAGSIWTGPDAIQHICQPQTVNGVLTCTGPDWTGSVVIPQTQVLVDLANNHLAQVTWVIPSGQASDHALSNDGSGPSWVASIVNAIGQSQYWSNTAIIITWDDWGGWYDHVAPKVINDGVSWGSGYVYGFRVPLIIVSPYAKSAYISHNTHDFGSILRLIETTFNLPSLNYADASADDFSDCFNFTQPPSSFRAITARLKAAFFIHDKRPPTDPDDD